MKYMLALFLVLIMCGSLIAETTSVFVQPNAGAYIKNTTSGKFENYMIGSKIVTEAVYLAEVNKPVYSPQALIEWGMETFPELIGTPHEYVLSKFAEQPVAYKNFMIQRGAIIDKAVGGTVFSDLARGIIAKATELGADLD